jgi:hypothetical protein
MHKLEIWLEFPRLPRQLRFRNSTQAIQAHCFQVDPTDVFQVTINVAHSQLLFWKRCFELANFTSFFFPIATLEPQGRICFSPFAFAQAVATQFTVINLLFA